MQVSNREGNGYLLVTEDMKGKRARTMNDKSVEIDSPARDKEANAPPVDAIPEGSQKNLGVGKGKSGELIHKGSANSEKGSNKSRSRGELGDGGNGGIVVGVGVGATVVAVGAGASAAMVHNKGETIESRESREERKGTREFLVTPETFVSLKTGHIYDYYKVGAVLGEGECWELMAFVNFPRFLLLFSRGLRESLFSDAENAWSE
jgi:hypothetical protein